MAGCARARKSNVTLYRTRATVVASSIILVFALIIISEKLRVTVVTATWNSSKLNEPYLI